MGTALATVVSCKVCSSPHRREVDAELAAGAAYRRVAAKFRLSPSSVWRHKSGHRRQRLDMTLTIGDPGDAASPLARMAELADLVRTFAQINASRGDARMVLDSIKTEFAILSKLTAELGGGASVLADLDTVTAAWQAARRAIGDDDLDVLRRLERELSGASFAKYTRELWDATRDVRDRIRELETASDS